MNKKKNQKIKKRWQKIFMIILAILMKKMYNMKMKVKNGLRIDLANR